MKIDRVKLINKILRSKTNKRYLEIGLGNGGCFFQIKSWQKYGVDPEFSFSRKLLLKYFITNYCNFFNRYYKTTSDNFFNENSDKFNNKKFSLIFIDGLHTYKQTLRDVENSLKCLRNDGIIIMHDCFPPTESSAYPAGSFDEALKLKIPNWTGEWCGDVWRTIVHLRSNYDSLKVHVLDCDYGIGIIQYGEPDSMLNLSSNEIDQLKYSDMIENKKYFLNLTCPSKYIKFLK